MKKIFAIGLLTISGSAFAAGEGGTMEFAESLPKSCGIDIASGKGGISFLDRDTQSTLRYTITSKYDVTMVTFKAVDHNLGPAQLTYIPKNGSHGGYSDGVATSLPLTSSKWTEDLFILVNDYTKNMDETEMYLSMTVDVSCVDIN